MKVDINHVRREIKALVPGFFGGIHFINGGRQVEYKLQKPNISFNYRVRATIKDYLSVDDLTLALASLVMIGMNLFNNHHTVQGFRTFENVLRNFKDSGVGYDDAYGAYVSRFADAHNTVKYRTFSTKKYGHKLARRLAIVNTNLIANPSSIDKYNIKNYKYIDEKNSSINIVVKDQERSFLYKSYITSNTSGIDSRVNLILADIVCIHALSLLKKLHTVQRLPIGIYLTQNKFSTYFRTNFYNNKTKKWSSRNRTINRNVDAYKEILLMRNISIVKKSKFTVSLKLKKDHYDLIKNDIQNYFETTGSTITEMRSKYIKTKLSEKKLRWDLMRLVTSLRRDSSNSGMFDPLYEYLNDRHIDTALKRIIRDIDGAQARF